MSRSRARSWLPCPPVHVVETAPPGGEAPAEWRLLTTLDVRTAKDAAETVGFHLQRWRIEDFFRALKSGCRTELLLFRTAVRLVAHLGGHRARKHDPDPGHQVMRHGRTRLGSAAMGHRIGFKADKKHALREDGKAVAMHNLS